MINFFGSLLSFRRFQNSWGDDKLKEQLEDIM